MKRAAIISLFFFLGLFAKSAQAIPPSCNPDAMAQAGDATKLPAQYMNPELMAIGDSLFNGVTSLTLTDFLAKNSVPALVAESLKKGVPGMTFQPAQYPDALVANLETELAQNAASLVRNFGKKAKANIEGWQARYVHTPGKLMMFDNIALAGDASANILCSTPSLKTKDWTKQPVVTGMFGVPAHPDVWYFNINRSHILNPNREDALSDLSALGQVRARKPKRLLISLGSNDGVWLMAFRALTLDEYYIDENGHPTTLRKEMDQLVLNMQTLARLIPPDTKVYLSNLVPPSRTPNLVRVGSRNTSVTCDVDAAHKRVPYFDEYQTYISTSRIRNISGADACQLDKAVSEYNAKIAAVMGAILGPRLAILDMNAMLWEYDFKHRANGKTLDVQWGLGKKHLSNKLVRPLGEGGISGYDNMHPSPPTYAELANRYRAVIGTKEAIATAPVSAQRAADRLRAAGKPTAINIGTVEYANLGLVHTFLLFVKDGSNPLVRMKKEAAGAACVLIDVLKIGEQLGEAERVNTDTACRRIALVQ